MLPAAYGAQKEVRARQTYQRCEAERQRLARAVDSRRAPAANLLLRALAQSVGWARRTAGAGLGAIRAYPGGSPGPHTEAC